MPAEKENIFVGIVIEQLHISRLYVWASINITHPAQGHVATELFAIFRRQLIIVVSISAVYGSQEIPQKIIALGHYQAFL
jgi:hypothetical protein